MPVEDIRKAIVEDNLHSLFRLVENASADANEKDLVIVELIDNVRRGTLRKESTRSF